MADQAPERRNVKRRVGDLLAALSCSLCEQLLTEPITSPVCLHTYCLTCIEAHIKLGAANVCPVCQADPDRVASGSVVVLGPKPFTVRAVKCVCAS